MSTKLDSQTRDRIQHWLDGNYDAGTKQAIRTLMDENEETKLLDAFYKDLEFGTGGIRGIIGVGSNRMNRYTVGSATQGLANYLLKCFPDQEIKVAIAYDSRNMSPEFARITADIFSANGIRVYLFEELRPTPELSFAIRHLDCQSGVVITASHNPREYNGYKAYWSDGSQVVAPHDKNIVAEVNKINSVDAIKFEGRPELITLIGEEIDEAFLETIVANCVNPKVIQRQKDLSIVFTPIHGTGITLVPEALARVGFENVHIVEEQATPDGNFPTVVYPNPEERTPDRAPVGRTTTGTAPPGGPPMPGPPATVASSMAPRGTTRRPRASMRPSSRWRTKTSGPTRPPSTPTPATCRR